MSNTRKIWSMPIALVMVLLFVASVGVYSFVQAQTAGNKTITADIGAGAANEFDKSVERVYGSAGIADNTTGIVTVSIAASNADAVVGPPAVPAIFGLDDGDAATPAQGISGYQLNHALFEISDAGVVTIKDGPTGSEAVNVAKVNGDDAPNAFTFDVHVFVDTDTTADGNATDDAAAELTSNQAARSGFVAASGVDDNGNDLNEINTLSVTVRVLKAKDAEFAAIPDAASVNDLLYGPDGESQGVAITGLTSAMTIREVGEQTDNAGIYGEADPQNVVWLKYTDPADAAINVDGGTDVTIIFEVSVDTDDTNADEDGTGTGTETPPRPTNATGDDVTVSFTATISVFDVLEFVTVPAAPSDTDPLVSDGSTENPYSGSIRSNAAMGDQALVIGISGAAAEEQIDVIVGSGNGPFTAEPRKVGDAYTQVIVKTSRELTRADEGMHSFMVTINGRALPTRTAQANVKINITASNTPPCGYRADRRQSRHRDT